MRVQVTRPVEKLMPAEDLDHQAGSRAIIDDRLVRAVADRHVDRDIAEAEASELEGVPVEAGVELLGNDHLLRRRRGRSLVLEIDRVVERLRVGHESLCANTGRARDIVGVGGFTDGKPVPLGQVESGEPDRSQGTCMGMVLCSRRRRGRRVESGRHSVNSTCHLEMLQRTHRKTLQVPFLGCRRGLRHSKSSRCAAAPALMPLAAFVERHLARPVAVCTVAANWAEGPQIRVSGFQ